MVTIDRLIIGRHRPTRTIRTRHECDECGGRCDPGSCRPQDWLYKLNGQELCWDCFLAESGAEIVE